MRKVLQPQYMSQFSCISSECDDTCCSGWRIAIDQESYEAYQELFKTEPSGIFEGKLTRDNLMPVQGNYAETVLKDNRCSFLTDNKLCCIQKEYGEPLLSVTCSVFPRSYNIVNGELESVLDFACPHAARLALLDPQPMMFTPVNITDDSRLHKIPTIDLSDTQYPNDQCPYFDEVRKFLISLLQNRQNCFEDRLIILGRFCNDLAQIQEEEKEGVLQLVNEYTDLIACNGFDPFIDTIPIQPGSMIKTLILLMEYRMKTGVTGNRFLDLYDLCKLGLCYSEEESEEDLIDRYQKVKQKHYDYFMDQHQYIFEHYFVNYIFKNLFPFGKQKSIYSNDHTFTVKKTVFTEYMTLVLHYSFIKNLLVGISGYDKKEFSRKEIVDLIQSYDKNITHDVPYFQRLLQFFSDNGMINMASAAMLVKN